LTTAETLADNLEQITLQFRPDTTMRARDHGGLTRPETLA